MWGRIWSIYFHVPIIPPSFIKIRPYIPISHPVIPQILHFFIYHFSKQCCPCPYCLKQDGNPYNGPKMGLGWWQDGPVGHNGQDGPVGQDGQDVPVGQDGPVRQDGPVGQPVSDHQNLWLSFLPPSLPRGHVDLTASLTVKMNKSDNFQLIWPLSPALRVQICSGELKGSFYCLLPKVLAEIGQKHFQIRNALFVFLQKVYFGRKNLNRQKQPLHAAYWPPNNFLLTERSAKRMSFTERYYFGSYCISEEMIFLSSLFSAETKKTFSCPLQICDQPI